MAEKSTKMEKWKNDKKIDEKLTKNGKIGKKRSWWLGHFGAEVLENSWFFGEVLV